jgi:hypothetical protein
MIKCILTLLPIHPHQIDLLNYINLLIYIYEKCKYYNIELIVDDFFQPYYLFSSNNIQQENHQKVDHILNSSDEFNDFIKNNSKELITIAFKDVFNFNTEEIKEDKLTKDKPMITFLQNLFDNSFKKIKINPTTTTEETENIINNNILYFDTHYKNNDDYIYYSYYLFRITHQMSFNETFMCNNSYFIDYIKSEKKDISIIHYKNILEWCFYLAKSNKIKYFSSSFNNKNNKILNLFSIIFNIPITKIY